MARTLREILCGARSNREPDSAPSSSYTRCVNPPNRTALTRFPPGVAEQIGHYVYMLSHPRTKQPFYVGKGFGDRVFAHARAALDIALASDKLDTIRAIRESGLDVDVCIVRHGLADATAFSVEATCIDLVGRLLDVELTNEVAGHDTERGLMPLDVVVEKYAAPKLVLEEPVLLVRVARKWRRGMPADELYEATRRAWRISVKRAARASFALSVANGIVRAVYERLEWTRIDGGEGRDVGRCEFSAVPALSRAHWVGGSVVEYLPDGSQNPLRFVNC
jgi:hypothetical protein